MGETKIKPVCSQNQLAFTKGTRKCFLKLSLHHEHHDVTSHISYVDSRQDKNSWMPWAPSLVRSPRRSWFLRKTKGSDKQSWKYKQTDNFLSKGNTEKNRIQPSLKKPQQWKCDFLRWPGYIDSVSAPPKHCTVSSTQSESLWAQSSDLPLTNLN